ncbi:MAG: ATP-dependent Clp protease adaptor ClpS [Planctomycetota bacterium]
MTTTAPTEQVQTTTPPIVTPVPHGQNRPKPQPSYHVVLLNDDDHTYEYVIEMLRKLFGHAEEQAFLCAHEVDHAGRVIVDTTTMERAELKRDQIHAYGRDWRIDCCQGSMRSTIEPSA